MHSLTLLLALSLPNGGEIKEDCVLQFTATWCVPCQQIAPLISKLEREGHPIIKIDHDTQRDLFKKYGIQNMPTFVLIKQGKIVARSGMPGEQKLRGWFASLKRDETSTSLKKEPSAPRYSPKQKANPNTAGATGSASAAAIVPRPNNTAAAPRSRIKPVQAPVVIRGNISDRSTLPVDSGKPDPMTASVRLRITDPKGAFFGSGTVIENRGGVAIILTCAHIFRDLSPQAKVEVDIFNGEQVTTFVGSLIKADYKCDVALASIRVDHPLPFCPIAPPEMRLQRGTELIGIGCSGGELPTLLNHKITTINRYVGPETTEVTGVPKQGRSGGGLFTADGTIVGVCSAADIEEKRGLFVGLPAIHRLLAAALPAKAIEEVKTATAGDLASDVTLGSEEEVEGASETEPEQPEPSSPTKSRTQSRTKGSSREATLAKLKSAFKGAGEFEITCIVESNKANESWLAISSKSKKK